MNFTDLTLEGWILLGAWTVLSICAGGAIESWRRDRREVKEIESEIGYQEAYMEIKIQIKDRVFSICFGHKKKWFQQVKWLTITEEFYNEKMEVVYANAIMVQGAK